MPIRKADCKFSFKIETITHIDICEHSCVVNSVFYTISSIFLGYKMKKGSMKIFFEHILTQSEPKNVCDWCQLNDHIQAQTLFSY